MQAFHEGDRAFSHYIRDRQNGISGWGTIESVEETYTGRVRGDTGEPMQDTTWYMVRMDEGQREYLDDAHGNWDLARLLSPEVAESDGYGKDPKPVATG